MSALILKRYLIYLYLLGLLIVMFACYELSFKKTIAAMKINKSLNNQDINAPVTEDLLPQVKRESDFYEFALNKYIVKKQNRESAIWDAVTAIAISNSLKVNYEYKVDKKIDSNHLKNGIFHQKFGIKGEYRQILGMLDSLYKTKKIGQVSRVHIYKRKAREGENNGLLNADIYITGMEQ